MRYAHALFQAKNFGEEKAAGKPRTRFVEGIATAITPDRYGDIVEPRGAEYKLPLSGLWQHRSSEPVGLVTRAAVHDDHIAVRFDFAEPTESQTLIDRVTEAWESVKLGLVRGFSIGFRPIEHSLMEETYSFHFLRWEWLELSLVTIPAHPGAEITVNHVKMFDTYARHGAAAAIDSVASGDGVVRLDGDSSRRVGLREQGSVFLRS
jgi:HK97 family phage prohead protease